MEAATEIDWGKRIGTNIRAARRAAGLSQQKLADAVGASRTQVVGWEGGHRDRRPGLEYVAKIAVVLGHTVGWFYDDHETEQP